MATGGFCGKLCGNERGVKVGGVKDFTCNSTLTGYYSVEDGGGYTVR